MEKVREYKYDNLKFILIFLVVLGHLIELSGINMLYIVIYIFHMPMFIYLSGYFSKCNPKSILSKIYIYIIWETIYFLVCKYAINEDIALNYLKTPIWILWYIFALIVWECIIFAVTSIKAKIIKQEHNIKSVYYLIIVAVLFIISILGGFINQIGYDYCLSRTITFFPYFVLGYLQRNKKLNLFTIMPNDKNKKIKTIIFICVAIITAIYFVICMNGIQARWLYGAYSYQNGGYTWIFKTMWILLSLSIIFILNNIVSNKKIKIISKIGSNTLIIYLVHGIIIKLLSVYSDFIFINNELINMLICFVIASVLVLALGNDFIKQKLQYLTNIHKVRDSLFK